MAIPQLLVHDKKDTVGVVVVEGLKAAPTCCAWSPHDNSSFKLKAKMDVPIGHKVALADIKKGDTIWKYGQDIGIAKSPRSARASTSTCTMSRPSGGERHGKDGSKKNGKRREEQRQR